MKKLSRHGHWFVLDPRKLQLFGYHRRQRLLLAVSAPTPETAMDPAEDAVSFEAIYAMRASVGGDLLGWLSRRILDTRPRAC